MTDFSEYFVAAAAKYLTAVDAEANTSNQHELGGLIRAGFGDYLGHPGDGTYQFDASYLFFSNELEEPLTAEGEVTWYDSRRYNPDRPAEYRLYYTGNDITELMSEGDLFVIALRPDRRLTMFIAPPYTSAARSLCYLFDVAPQNSLVGGGYTPGEKVDYVRGAILQVMNLAPSDYFDQHQAGESVSEIAGTYRLVNDELQHIVIRQFGETFPKTAIFSEFARETFRDKADITSDDELLLAFMQHEEGLFFALERVGVEKKLDEGFNNDVDEFIKYSLGIHNRRKSRVGHALEHHLSYIFANAELLFDRGKKTEKKSKPDFLFPGIEYYKDPQFDRTRLLMLGAKTTCKERWRQVLVEAAEINNKHLLTLETAISEAQTDEMESHRLQLVVPEPIHDTYTSAQAAWLMSLEEFIVLAKSKQEDMSGYVLI